MRIGEVRGREREKWGKPLAGVRVLAAEQMQALPFATQLMAHLGAEVVKIEHPVTGDQGRGAQPTLTDADGREAATVEARSGEVMPFRIEGSEFVSASGSAEVRVPATHSVQNIGETPYKEILIEFKT